MTAQKAIFQRFAQDFLGLDRTDPVVGPDGEAGARRRIYLDTTATGLMPRVVWSGLAGYFEAASANSHTEAHRAGRDTTHAIEASRDAMGRLVGYDSCEDVVLFTANGATGATNFLARALFPPELRSVIKRFPEGAPESMLESLRAVLGEHGSAMVDQMLRRPVVVTTCMEHHSNLLPWFEAVGRHNVRAVEVLEDGSLDMEHLERILAEDGDQVRLVAVTGVSNVTGILNPVHRIARMVHAVGAQILVDGAQWVPHAPVQMHPPDPAEVIDYLVLSGHKLYAPGSRGALIGNLTTLADCKCVTDVGGGMVEYVALDDFELKEEVTAREEPGTPNIPGSIAMGLIAELLLEIGMDTVAEEEHGLASSLVHSLASIDGVTVYGSTDLEKVPRAGVVAFNVDGVEFGLVAAYLNDFHNIAVRDGCFCAHPYIKRLLKIDAAEEARFRAEMAAGDRRRVPGMVRASLGVYSTQADIVALEEALRWLVANRSQLKGMYVGTREGDYHLRDGTILPQTFSVRGQIESWLEGPV